MMTAQSVTGTSGPGSSGKFTTNELSILANSPSILVAGRVEVIESDIISSPPVMAAIITLPRPLPGNPDNYVVIVTGLNTPGVFVATMDEDDDGNFFRFSLLSDAEGTAMYIITKVGLRPDL